MAYRYDGDLEFLGQMKSEELEDLVSCLTHDRDGAVRYTEELTMNELYKRHHPDHQKYWELIAAEIQCFGANSFATILRGGKGVEYKEVLMDVCDKLKVNYNKSSSVEKIEGNLLMKILTDAIENMTPEEIKELAAATGVKNTNGITAEAMVGVFQAVFRAGGFKSYQLTLIIVNAVLKALIGRGLSLAGNAALTRTMAILTGPIGWVITGLWTAIDIAGAAYRVTIPAVIQVAALRQKHLYEKQASELSFS
ncbi:YaaW family protein [Pseudaeromonas pectinilytica]